MVPLLRPRLDRLSRLGSARVVLLLLHLLVCHGVPVTSGDGSLAALAGLLALEHLAVADNAVALALRDVVALPGLLAGGGCPGKVITADLYVVIGEFAKLVVVHTEELSLLRSAEVKAGDEVDGVGDEGADDEDVCRAGDNVSDLLVQRGEVLAEETTIFRSDLTTAAKADNVVGAEEGVEEKTPHASDAVLCEHIHGVIDSDPVLDLGGKVGNDAGSDTKDNGSPGSEEAGSRSSGDEARNETRAPADHGPLARKAPVKKNPGHRTEHTSKVGVPASHDSAEVGTESRATVEREPAEPEEDGAESDEGDVVRAEVEHHLLLTTAKNHGVGERSHTRHNLDGSTAGVVENTPSAGPAVAPPNPACNRAVDNRGPEEGEDEEGNQTAALSDGACSDGGGNGAELHLVEGEEEVGDEGRSGTGHGECVHETEFPEVADEAVGGSIAERERVSPEVPLEANDRV